MAAGIGVGLVLGGQYYAGGIRFAEFDCRAYHVAAQFHAQRWLELYRFAAVVADDQ
ncbi:hypothetical protein D3C85_1091100 [compost metagenome]